MTRRNAHTLAMCLAILGIGVFLALCSEHIYVNHGLGWDGGVYADIALRFQGLLAGEKLPYPILYFRYLPSALAWGAMKVTGTPLTIPNAISTFLGLIVGLFFLMSLAWSRAADALNLSAQGKWLGWMGLFLNYAVLKFAFYYPTLTDAFALSFATFILYAYVVRRRLLLLLFSILGFFVWPVLPVVGGFLLVFPRKDLAGTRPDGHLGRWIASGLAGLVLAVVYILGKPLFSDNLDQIFYVVMPLSIGLVFLYLYFLIAGLFGAPGLFDPACGRRELVLLAGLFACGLLALALSTAVAPAVRAEAFAYARDVVTNGIRRPAEFLVAHTLYFGPVVLLAVCRWREVAAAVSRFGWGMALSMALLGYQAINPLSRQVILLGPFLAVLTALGFEDRRLSRGFLLFFAFLSLLFSKVWYAINYGLDTSIPGDQNPVFWPRFVNSTGFWMKTEDYLWQGAVVVVTLFLLLIYLRTVPRQDAAAGGKA